MFALLYIYIYQKSGNNPTDDSSGESSDDEKQKLFKKPGLSPHAERFKNLLRLAKHARRIKAAGGVSTKTMDGDDTSRDQVWEFDNTRAAMCRDVCGLECVRFQHDHLC